jgi:hypothetical protein
LKGILKVTMILNPLRPIPPFSEGKIEKSVFNKNGLIFLGEKLFYIENNFPQRQGHHTLLSPVSFLSVMKIRGKFCKLER